MQQRVALTVNEFQLLMANTDYIRLGPVRSEDAMREKPNKRVKENNPNVPEKKKQRDHDMKDNYTLNLSEVMIFTYCCIWFSVHSILAKKLL